ncbi:MAG: plasmid pRiA4b ORF-3 family protein [Paenisporosarcina sp.]
MKAYQFLIKLEGVEQEVWRRLVIPAETNFKRLHETIQMAMGWSNYHLYAFNIPMPNGRILELAEDQDMMDEHRSQIHSVIMHVDLKELNTNPDYQQLVRTDIKLAQKTKLPKYVERMPSFSYRYDFGDNWIHHVHLERTIDDYEYVYPQIMDGKGNCPPEDVGGPIGYANFLAVMKNPEDEEHEHLKNWAASQGYSPFDQAFTNNLMQNVLKLKRI